MAFKDIVVQMDNSSQCRTRLALAMRLAGGSGGHVVGLHVRTQAVLPTFLAVQFGPEIEALRLEMNAEAAKESRAIFDAVAPQPDVTTEWRDVEGTPEETLALHARYADLTIVGQGRGDEVEPAVPGALALAVGRPVLVVPSVGTFPTLGERVVVAWNGSREATRAVHDALPLLRRAKLVRIIAINPQDGMDVHGDIPGADICTHLSRHGVPAVCEHIRSDDVKVGAMLLSRAAEEAADMIVMGAFGRSRISELVLGGATRHLLRHMTVPVMLSH